MRPLSKTAVLVLACVVLVQNVSESAWSLFERKNIIHAKAEIAQLVRSRYQSYGGNSFRLFFPFATKYVADQFASYLNYRGIPAEGIHYSFSDPVKPNSLVLATRDDAGDQASVRWTSLTGDAISGPRSGDLLIVLPDDNVWLASVSM
jgi:hypothetical protein